MNKGGRKYSVKRLTKADYRQTEWSGGTTTELAIGPLNGSYSDRNFDWRISTAEIREQTSLFTHLPDYDRMLMTLRGRLRLTFDGRNVLGLDEFSPCLFDGASEISSVGTAVDFNLMVRKGKCAGTVFPVVLKESGRYAPDWFLPDELAAYSTLLLYCSFGELTVEVETNEKFRIISGESLWFTGNFDGIDWLFSSPGKMLAAGAAVRYLAEPLSRAGA